MAARNPTQRPIPYALPSPTGRAAAALFAATVVFALFAAWRLVSGEASTFLADVVVDDAAYFLVPARHLLEGRGYSFDGVYPTNGVQPLWALVTLGLAALIPDDLLALRAMSLLSGLLWLAGGVLLFLALHRSRRLPGLLIAGGWSIAGYVDRSAFQGMENGLHGLLCVLLVVFAVGLHRRGSAGVDRPALAILGLLAALLTLSRIEAGLLSALLLPCILRGWFSPPRRDAQERQLRRRSADALAFLLPSLILVGGALVASKYLFDSFTPISGRVKMFYESRWSGAAPVHGSWTENLYWHFKFVRHLALAPLSDFVSRAMSLWFSWIIDAADLRRILLAMYGLGLGYLSIRSIRSIRRGRRDRTHGPAVVLVRVLATFALLHLVLMATLLPHFTGYATWYFPAEVLAMWIFAGWTLWGCLGLGAAVLPPRAGRRLLQVARLGLPLAVVVAAVPAMLAPPTGGPRIDLFLRAGRWLDESLPPGQRIGCCSAGLVAIAAPRHRVYNLDGLISSTRYFEDFLSRDRLHDFFAQEEIRYFADYQPLATWRDGISWHGNIALDRLCLLRWWRLDEGAGYAVCEILPEVGRSIPAGADRLAELRFAAEVLGRFDVVDENDLAGRVAQGGRVAASIPLHPSGRLRHVVLDAAGLDALDLPPAGVPPEQELSIRFDDGFALYGFDAPSEAVRAGERTIVTCYWVRTGTVPGDRQEHRVILQLRASSSSAASSASADGEPVLVAVEAGGVPCQGTRPPATWRSGQAVVDTHVLALPGDLEPGTYRLFVQVVRSDQTAVPGRRHGDGDQRSAESFFLAQIRVE